MFTKQYKLSCLLSYFPEIMEVYLKFYVKDLSIESLLKP